MRSLIMLWALILSLGLTSISHAEPATEGPTSAPAVAARKKLDASVAKADQVQRDAVSSAREAYLASLRLALDAAMKAGSLEDSKWAKAEIDHMKAGEPGSADRPKLPVAAAAQTRFNRSSEKAQEDRKRLLDIARKQYVADLEAAKRTALSDAKDLEEASRIAAESERAKVMEFGQAVTNVTAGGASPVATSSERTPGKINLLKLVDLDRDPVLYGIFRWDKESLLVDGDGYKVIRLPYQPPLEYDFSVEFTVLELRGDNDLILNASAGDGTFLWLMGYGKNTFCGIGHANGGVVSQVQVGNVLEIGKRTRTTVKVRADNVSAWIGDRQILSRAGDPSQFSVTGLAKAGLRVLGLSTWDKVRVHSAEVTEISGPGRILRRLEAQEAQSQSQAFRRLSFGRNVSLTELRPRAIQIGWNSYMVNQNPYRYPVKIDGKECDRYLFAHAPSSLLFDIPEGATGFRTKSVRHAGIARDDVGQWRVAVTVDDCELLLSRGIREEGGQIVVELPLPKGARQIELRADPLGDGNWDYCIWANPEFLFPQ